MSLEKRELGILFHSGSYDRIYHGLSIALAALALGREVKVFFTYWSLYYLKKKGFSKLKFNKEAIRYKDVIDKNIKRGHLKKISELITQVKEMGAKFYACTGSMGLLNIARDELREEVDKSMGLAAFLTETNNDQILFI